MTQQEYRQKLKKYHICRECKKQDAYTLNGRTYCADCAEKIAERKRKERAKDGGLKNKIACKKWKEKNESEHRCKKCGRALADSYTYKTCEYCRAKQRERLRKRRIENGILPWDMRCNSDVCFQCGKKTPISGKRLCKECYESKLKVCMPQFEKMAEKGRDILRNQNKLFQKREL